MKSRRELAEEAVHAHGDPSGRMLVCAVTGTNGKTTSTYLLESILKAAGRNPAVIGTVEMRLGSHRVPSTLTTPGAPDLQKALADFLARGADAVALEVSSHALDQYRVGGMRFAAALFTNLTRDHLDYHATIEEYFATKARLFLEYPVNVRVIHQDDPYGARLIGLCQKQGFEPITFGDEGADASYGRLVATAIGITGDLALAGKLAAAAKTSSLPVRSPLIGRFNAQNLAGAAAVALGLGIPPDAVAAGLACAPQVPGRMERVPNSRGALVLVDYAHTPDALENALRTLRPLTPRKLLCAFGCGGDRDPGKRPLMGAAAEKLADEVFVTSDNPRSEDPGLILDAILAGMRDPARAHRVPDRREAIGQAIGGLQAGDTLLIAGKGHENHQIVGERKLPFDDREVAKEFLRT